MIVVDTNILAHTWLPSEIKDQIQRLIRIDHEWIAPILWRSEFRSILAKYLRLGLLSEAKANDIATLAEEQMTHREFSVPTREVLATTLHSSLSSYDAEFVVLARMKKTTLVTLDKAIARAFPTIAILLDRFIHEHTF
ncbi:MAG: hypothetical protein OZSIB_4021 [Candidatus Ozemobacter sibiricus]|uniref:Ribonuclease VapC n=1 Tax=Candidatus Ozemobacter sibiricus TaxID=2268124 RepID=A0A367ZPW3_9BACT|nr:MAG: hypothetical protein OZSIB_4021 [Candidatus Ozemobacter sibiricus]